MNATSAGDGCPIPGTCIPGPRRPGSRMKRVHTTTKKNPQQEGNPMTPLNLLKIPLPPKLKESAQSPELKTSKQMRTLRQMKPLAYIISYSQAQLPPAQTHTTDGQIQKAPQGSPNTCKCPQQYPKFTCTLGPDNIMAN